MERAGPSSLSLLAAAAPSGATWAWIVFGAVALAVLAGVLAVSLMRRENRIKDELAKQAGLREQQQRLRRDMTAYEEQLQALRSQLFDAPPRESEHAVAHTSLLRAAEDRARALQGRLTELEQRQDDDTLARRLEATSTELDELRARHERLAHAVAELPPDEGAWDVRHFRA